MICRKRDRLLIKKSYRQEQNHLIKVEIFVYNPGSRAVRPWRFQGGYGVPRGVKEDRSLPRPVGETGRRSVGNRKERLRDYASSPRNPNPPYSPRPQRSAELVGVCAEILSKYIRIVIVAFGSAPILDYRRFAHGLRWAAAQTCLRDFIPQTPFFASRLSKKLSQQSVPIPHKKRCEPSQRFFVFINHGIPVQGIPPLCAQVPSPALWSAFRQKSSRAAPCRKSAQ